MMVTSQSILEWIEKAIPRGIDLVTTFAAISLLFASYTFYRQYRAHPGRKLALSLCLFFLIDGLDYLIFSLAGSILDPATATLLGIVCDSGVVGTSLVFVFSQAIVRAEDENQLVK